MISTYVRDHTSDLVVEYWLTMDACQCLASSRRAETKLAEAAAARSSVIGRSTAGRRRRYDREAV